MGLAHYEEGGVPADVLAVKTRDDAQNAAFAERAERASMIYFSGGKPSRLADILRDSALLAAIRRAIDRGAVYAGCSAGAMVASRERNAGGRGGTSWLFGLGLVPHVSFGVHWDRAARIPGAQWWLTSRLPDDTWFVGIDERTAIAGDGLAWQVHGLGSVTVRHGGAVDRHTAGERFETSGEQVAARQTARPASARWSAHGRRSRPRRPSARRPCPPASPGSRRAPRA